MTRFAAFLLMSALPATVSAHAGAHDMRTLPHHLLREPDHLLAILAVVAIGIAAIARFRKAR